MSTLTIAEEKAVIGAYLRDAEAAERFFATWSGTEPRPLDVVRASIEGAVGRMKQDLRGQEADQRESAQQSGRSAAS